jgi:hypothetical protein
MVCEEKMRLVGEYTATTTLLFVAVTMLNGKTGVGFSKALTAVEAARAKCLTARQTLCDHRILCEECSVAASKSA